MRVMRPFPKELLKKMFLKTLYENGEINTCEQQNLDFITIVCNILSKQLEVSELSEYEFNDIRKAVSELESENFIEPVNIYGSAKVKMLTKKGRGYAETVLKDFALPSFEIETLITRQDLKEESLVDYFNGDYEIALLKAFRLVEETTRKVKDPSSKITDKNNLSTSFISAEGIYNESHGTSVTEPDSLERITSGAMSWFKKNAKGESFNAQAAAQILLFINIHLNVIDKKIVTI